jgi:hypothetical protein
MIMRLARFRDMNAGVLSVLLTLLVFISLLHFLQMLAREIERSPLVGRASAMPEETKQTHIRFLIDGSYHRIEETVTRSARGPHRRHSRIYDDQGHLVWEGADRSEKAVPYIRWASEGHLHWNRRWLASKSAVGAEFSRVLEVLVPSEGDAYVAWRYQPTKRIFIGYDMRGDPVGYAGLNGFVAEGSECRPFESLIGFQAWVPERTDERTMLWATAQGLYQIQFTSRQMERLFTSPEVAIEYVSWHGWMPRSVKDRDYVDPNDYRPLILCKTADDTLHLILREPDERIRCVSPADNPDTKRRHVQVAATREAVYLVLHEALPAEPNAPWPTDWKRILHRVGPQGELREVARATSRLSSGWVRIVDGRSQFERYLAAVSPPVYRWIRPDWIPWPGLLETDFGRWFLTLIPGGVEAWFLSLAAMVLTGGHVWPREGSWLRRLSWLVLVGLFGVTGLLTYLALNQRAVIRCDACGKRRGLQRSDCVRCGSALRRPRPQHTILNPA